VGVAFGLSEDFGIDPRGWRFGTGARLEGATGTFDYARAAVDVTASRGIGSSLEAALTASVGSSVGTLPPQRLWYIGGPQTVRGQIAGQDSGDAYWFSRASLAYGLVAVRPTLFFDVGWAGPRADWVSPGRPMTGAGAGVSFLDGLLHFDLARGIQPTRSWRGALYLDARF
jgi:hemolysin activation/secretion protein